MNVKADLMGRRRTWFMISGLAVLAGLISLLTLGMNLGIDFTGGSILERGFETPVTVKEIKEVLASEELAGMGLEKSVVQITPNGKQAYIRTVELKEFGKIDEALEKKFGEVEVLRTEMVGPVIGSELIKQALWALVLASLLIVVYVAIRFHNLHGVVAGGAAIAAVIHDVLITLGILSLLGREINSPFVAAILTVVGYSINDTIVVFDRIRENMQYRRKEPVDVVANRSVFETLPRSINTSLTTLFVVGALLIFGGSSIKDFILTLFIGILVGTYSSIFIASPLWVSWRKWQEKKATVQ